mmetsp:Transcript_14317/g.56345  ORF Transcript_14317/g.56345 Transcript_14317/m.56345 type:complete len:623 (+) Transcript_14317:198-2066(+)
MSFKQFQHLRPPAALVQVLEQAGVMKRPEEEGPGLDVMMRDPAPPPMSVLAQGQALDEHILKPITCDRLQGFVAMLQGKDDEPGGAVAKQHVNLDAFDLRKAFGFRAFPLLAQILSNPLQELISSTGPFFPEGLRKEEIKTGFAFLFDGRFENFKDDGIKWKKATRMSVKLIIMNHETKAFKLKNNKSDEGVAVMRRQTWRSEPFKCEDEAYSWRRHEYKAILREQYYKHKEDGTVAMNETQTVQPYPALIHYFAVRESMEALKVSKKRKHDEMYVEEGDGTAKASSSAAVAPKQPTNTASSPAVVTAASPSYSLSPLALDLLMEVDSFTSSTGGGDTASMLTGMESLIVPPTFDSLADGSSPPVLGTIKTYAPDKGICLEATKIIVQVDGLGSSSESSYRTFTSMFADKEVPCQELAPGVIQFYSPDHYGPGVQYFYIRCRNVHSGRDSYTHTVPFCFLPVEESQKMSLNFNSLQCNTNAARRDICHKFKHFVKELDLSNSTLRNIDFLVGMNKLVTLVLDNNHIDSDIQPPTLPNLRTLSVNGNRIDNLEVFIETVKRCFPALRALSMLNNRACPYFSSMTHRYYNYRLFVLSVLPWLNYLDSTAVTHEERLHAQSISEE